MLTKIAAIAILAFTSAVEAAPKAESFDRRQEAINSTGPGTVDPAMVAKGGAIDILNFWRSYSSTAVIPTPTATATVTAASGSALITDAPTRVFAVEMEAGADAAADAPQFWTISLINRLGRDIQTNHANNIPGPVPTPNRGSGVLANGASDFITVPLGWGGNIAVVENGGGRTFRGDESQLEASYADQGIYGGKRFDINVSYVNGFSLPITCSCDVGVIAGCNKYLWNMGSCPNDNGVGSCRNPQRYVNNGPAAPFFAPCAHAAYVYPFDDSANSGNGVCGGSTVTCCVGTNCPSNPRQP